MSPLICDVVVGSQFEFVSTFLCTHAWLHDTGPRPSRSVLSSYNYQHPRRANTAIMLGLFKNFIVEILRANVPSVVGGIGSDVESFGVDLKSGV